MVLYSRTMCRQLSMIRLIDLKIACHYITRVVLLDERQSATSARAISLIIPLWDCSLTYRNASALMYASYHVVHWSGLSRGLCGNDRSEIVHAGLLSDTHGQSRTFFEPAVVQSVAEEHCYLSS